MKAVYGSEYIGRYIKIIDKRVNNTIASGKVIGSKNDIPNGGISFDNKWFFRETDILRYEEVPYVETKLITEKDLEQLGLKWEYLHKYIERESPEIFDVRRDYGYDELDKDIEQYIYRFNNISDTIKTTTSCCGHGIKPWYIEFEFKEFWDLSLFINIVELFSDINLSVNHGTAQVIKKKNIHLMLEAVGIDKGCTKLKEFCELIEKEFKKKKMM